MVASHWPDLVHRAEHRNRLVVALRESIEAAAPNIAVENGTIRRLFVQIGYHLGGASAFGESVPGRLVESRHEGVRILDVYAVRVTGNRFESMARRT